MRPDARLSEWAHMLRLPLLGVAICATFAVLAPGQFANWTNAGNIVRATTTDALAAVGFTLVMLVGHLDLSIGATMCLGGVVLIFAEPSLGWLGAVLAAAAAGMAVGLTNGLLVSRAKVNSFIATLGTMTILQGLCRVMLEGGSRSLPDAAVGLQATEWLNAVLPWSPRVVLALLPMVVAEVVLRRTAVGRNLYLVGADSQVAYNAGVPVNRLLTLAFVASGALAALGGALTAAAQNTVMPNLGEKTLMLVVASVIAGGTAMTGGRGSVSMSVLALLLLNALTNGMSYLGASKSAKLVAQGLVLAIIILHDAWRQRRIDRTRGQRRELLRELEGRSLPLAASGGTIVEQGSPDMQPRQPDRTFAMVCVTAMACVAMVTVYAMWSRGRLPAPSSPTTAAGSTHAPSKTASDQPVDPLSLKATDNQPLVWIDDSPLKPPTRPADPEKLADDDVLRWYDYEFAGWTGTKLPQPKSPGDGPKGKKVVSLQYMDHPYWKGYGNGMKRLAEAYGFDLTIMEAGNDNKVQMDQVEQAIEMRPDMVILTPVDANGVVPMLKRLYDAKVPTIASNLIPVDAGMKYVITWTGPDDWGQFRMLARAFAEKMGNQGSYCVVRHLAGTSCYLSRTWGAVSELKKVAPAMTCLDMQTTDLQAEKTKTQVAAWLKTYGSKLKGIVSADDSKAQVGIVEALKDAGRDDVVCVAAGSSRTGLEYIKEGKVYAITYQSAEADGALPIEIAARWFRGEPITRPIYYLQKHVITAKDVDRFLPAQW